MAAGAFALSDGRFATLISIKLIGLTAIATGAFEILHAFWTRAGGAGRTLLGFIYLRCEMRDQA
jgi:uncharacterized membrane protein HdeD (DUF308 family)